MADLVSQLRFSTSKMRAMAIAVASVTAALVCGVAYFHREPAWKNRVYRVGVDGTPPWAEMGPNGEPGGLAVALLREAARRRGIKLQWVLITGTSPDAAIQQRRVDLWPAVGVMAARKKQFHLSTRAEEWRYSSVGKR